MSLLKVILLLHIGAALGVTLIYFLPLQDLSPPPGLSLAALEKDVPHQRQQKGNYKLEEKLAKLMLIIQNHTLISDE